MPAGHAFWQLSVAPDPAPHDLTRVLRGVVPDQQQGGFALGGQQLRAPGQKLRRQIALTGWPVNTAIGAACLAEVLVDHLNGDGALPHRRRYPLHRSMSHVADAEHSGDARL